MQKTFLKRFCIKLQHTNDPDKVGPDKNNVISCCSSVWWNEKPARIFFQHYNYLDAKLDPFTGTKRREMWNFRGLI